MMIFDVHDGRLHLQSGEFRIHGCTFVFDDRKNGSTIPPQPLLTDDLY